MKTITLLAALLTGCIAGQVYPDSQKFRQCEYEAIKATYGQTYGAKSALAGAYFEAQARREILDACMRQ